MIVLGLDLSSHTGWSLFKDGNLLGFGILNIKHQSDEYPWGIYDWAIKTADEILKVCAQYNFVDKFVIEQTNLGRNRIHQTFLEWLHFGILHKFFQNNLIEKIEYVDTFKWRKKLQLQLTKEQKKQNKFVVQQHQNGQKNVLQNGKRIGRVTPKHLAVAYANNTFSLNLKHKDNDMADAICIGHSFFN